MELPVDCWGLISRYLPLTSLLAWRETCRYFRDVVVRIINQTRRQISIKTTRERSTVPYLEKVNQLAGLYRRLALWDTLGSVRDSFYPAETWKNCPNISRLTDVKFYYVGNLPFDLAPFSAVTSLYLTGSNTRFTGSLLNFTQLRQLHLENQPQLSFRGVTSLTSIHLERQSSPDMMDDLATLTQLRSLTLSRSSYDQFNYAPLVSLEFLTTLHFQDVEFTDDLFSLLQSLPALVSYRHTRMHNMLNPLLVRAPFPTQLVHLDIYQTRMTSDFLSDILQLPCLEELKLNIYNKEPIFPICPRNSRLRSVSLSLGMSDPWMDLSGLSQITQLQVLSRFHAESISSLTNLRHLTLKSCPSFSLDFSRFPQLDYLMLDSTIPELISFQTLYRPHRIDFIPACYDKDLTMWKYLCHSRLDDSCLADVLKWRGIHLTFQGKTI